jgi:hypothetical protein
METRIVAMNMKKRKLSLYLHWICIAGKSAAIRSVLWIRSGTTLKFSSYAAEYQTVCKMPFVSGDDV